MFNLKTFSSVREDKEVVNNSKYYSNSDKVLLLKYKMKCPIELSANRTIYDLVPRKYSSKNLSLLFTTQCNVKQLNISN